jgi:acetyl/propionyl-CoA carboxylase alpha subunit
MAKMTFIGTLDAREHTVLVENVQDDHVFQVSLDGRTYTVDAHAMPSEIVTALIDNKSYDIDLERASENTLDGRLGVRVRGRVIYLDMLDERRKKMRDAQATRFAENGVARICSPMPGKVLRVMVSVGQEVLEGQGVVVVEAMKMENELKSPKNGVVKELRAKVGDSVDTGALLLVIE